MCPLDPPLEESADEIRRALAPLRNDVSIAIECAGNAFAVGAVIRVAHSFLVRDVLLIGTESHYEKASMGMHRLETVLRLPTAEAFLAHAAGRPVIAFERERAKRSVYDVTTFPEGAILLFGSERFGIGETLLARADETLAIPMYGVNNSLPVAVAAGIAMSWWGRCRYREGVVVSGK